MVSDSLEELHQMASQIGVARKHFQDKSYKPHYDVCRKMKRKAIELGAIEVEEREIIILLKRSYGKDNLRSN